MRSDKLLVGLDVDEVVCAMHEAWAKRWNRHFWYKPRIEPKDIEHCDLNEKFPGIYTLLDGSLYSNGEVIPMFYAAEAVDKIRGMGHQIIYVTACGPHNCMAGAKLDWLVRKGLFKPGDLYRPAMEKATAPVDILLDDSVQHCAAVRDLGRTAVLMRRPHNENEEWNGLQVRSVPQFARWLAANLL